MKFIRFRYILLLFSLTSTVKAQEPVSIHLTGKDGLPDSVFHSMIEDSEGFIWFASNKGLNRYDGKSFKHYSNPNKKGRSLFNLRLDSKGTVWCNNISGQFFYIANDSLKLFKNYQNELNIGVLVDYNFLNNKLLIPKVNKILSIDISTKRKVESISNFLRINSGDSIENELVFFDKDLNITIIKEGFKTQLSIKNKDELKTISHCLKFKINNNSFIFLTDKIQNTSHLYLLDIHNKNTIPVILPDEIRNSYIGGVTLINNKIYLATNNGVFKALYDNHKITINSHFLKKERITKIIQDKNKNIWVPSFKNGIYVIPNNELFVYKKIKKINVLEKKNDSVCFLGKQNGELLEFNFLKNKLKIHSTSKKPVEKLDYNEKTQKLFVSGYYTLIYDEKTKKNNFIELGAVKSVSRINDSTYLISQHIGTIIKTPKTTINLTKVRSYGSIYNPTNKKIYVADIEGVKVFNLNGKKTDDITFNNSHIYGFGLTVTSNGIVCLATYDNGVIIIDDNMVVENINTANGLASNLVNCLTADGNNLWISTGKGIQFYNSTTKELQIINKQDGINSYEIRDIEVLNNTIIYANNLGVYGFDKTKIFKKKIAPNVYITDVSIQGKSVKIQEKYELKHNENDIDISFNTKNFQSLKNIRYEYKFNNNLAWTPIKEGVDFIKLINLPPGKFNFQLRAKNKFTTNYSKIVKLNINILAPFYRRWWFLTILGLLLTGSIILYFKRKTKRLQKQQAKDLEKERISKALVFSQLENLRSQMNPHFIFNALNSVQDYIILNEKKLARHFLVKFSRLIRIYLEHSQESTVSLDEELKALHLYLALEKSRFNDTLDYTISVADNISPIAISIPPIFLQPYVENALKHGLLHKENNKMLTVDFSFSNDKKTLVCVIEDNGIGRAASEKIKNRVNLPKSFATKANEKRIDLINSTKLSKITLEIIDKTNSYNEPTGTKIIIKIPTP